MSLAPSTYRYQPHNQGEDLKLIEALKNHAQTRRRWGYRRLAYLLRRDGFRDNHKRIYRLYREAGLQVRRRRKRKTAEVDSERYDGCQAAGVRGVRSSWLVIGREPVRFSHRQQPSVLLTARPPKSAHPSADSFR